MFETSVVQARAQAAGGRYSLLTLSLMAHSAVIVGALVASIASTEFPLQAPREFALAPTFMPVTPPPPLGVRPAGPKPVEPVARPQPAVAVPTQPVAPSTVPDTITTAEPIASTVGTGDPSAAADGPSGPIGVPWGTKGGTGDLDAPPGPATNVQPEPEKIYEVHEVKAPVALYKPQPEYPSHLIRTRMPATVVVRCIIDKNGHVRDPRIVVPAMPPFNQAVLNAITNWRYTPGARNGIAVETYMDVTVRFAVN
jgi:periplasmic protein TonB